jgi:hypothetical protein
VAHLTSKNRGFVQCLCGENIFTLARKGVFSGNWRGENERLKHGLNQFLQGLKRVFAIRVFWKNCDTESISANVYRGVERIECGGI